MPGPEIRFRSKARQKIEICDGATDAARPQRIFELRKRGRTVRAVNDQLGDQRIIKGVIRSPCRTPASTRTPSSGKLIVVSRPVAGRNPRDGSSA